MNFIPFHRVIITKLPLYLKGRKPKKKSFKNYVMTYLSGIGNGSNNDNTTSIYSIGELIGFLQHENREIDIL